MSTFRFSNTAWKVITGAVVILSLIAGLWQFDDRYAKAGEVVNTLEAFQTKQNTINDGLRLDILNIEYGRAREELKNLKYEAKTCPEDTEVEMRIMEVSKRINEINNKRTVLRNELLGID